MLKDGTVFVVGAGLSAELDLPLGGALKAEILGVLPDQRGGGMDAAREALFARGNQKANSRACAAIRNGLGTAASIDNFVEHHSDNASLIECAKVGIVGAILRGERRSRLYLKEGETRLRDDVQSSTFGALFRLVVGSCSRAALPEAFARIAFVNFNYDRCLEQYLFSTLIHHSGIASHEAGQIVDNLNIWHPYGWIGCPEWSSKFASGEARVRYGADPERYWLENLAANIRTFSEERASGEDEEIQAALASASQVIFLGCAFHRQNLRLIEPSDASFEAAFGTCYLPTPQDPSGLATQSMQEFSAPTARAFRTALRNWKVASLPEESITFEPLTSLQLVTKYGAEWLDS